MISDILAGFSSKKVLVVGDSILDAYYYGDAVGQALECPILLAHEKKVEFVWGGASNVVRNLLELGADVAFVTLLGSDDEAGHYEDFSHERFRLFAVKEDGKGTIVKRRFYVKKEGVDSKYFEQHRINEGSINEDSAGKVLDFVRENIRSFDVVMLVDYRLGLLTPALIDGIKTVAKENGKFTIAGSQVFRNEPNYGEYAGVDIICMNSKELEAADPGMKDSSSDEELKKFSESMHSGICVTCGKAGSKIAIGGKVYSKDAIDVEEVDSCGAGDSFLAAFALSSPDKDPESALYLGNVWAGLSVKEIGTAVPKRAALEGYAKD